MSSQPAAPAAAAPPPEGGEAKTINWVEDKMATQFANVVNVQGTREQVDLFFGTNRTWNPESGQQVTVDLSSRVILTPIAAKRLMSVLAGVLREHERRYGALEVE